MTFFLKVGTVLHDGTNISVRDGKPLFTGQVIVPVETAMKIENFPFYYPVIPEFFTSKEEKKDAFRYYGYLDLDMDVDAIQSGHSPLIASRAAKPYAKKAHIKKELTEWMQTNVADHMTFDEVCEHIPALQKVAVATRACVESIKQKGFEAIPFFSGLKGTRILWYDELLWRKVRQDRTDAGDAGLDLIKSYFSDVAATEALKHVDLDASVYGRGKGLKPDMLPHPCSGLAPLPLFDLEDGSWATNHLMTREPVEELSAMLMKFWCELFANVKVDAPIMETGLTKYLVKNKRMQPSSEATVTRKQKVKKPRAESRVEGLMSLAEPECHIHTVKDGHGPGQYIVVLTSDHKRCHIKGTSHSHNKVYYLVDTIRGSVRQKCHSEGCASKSKILWPRIPDVSDEDMAFYQYQISRSTLAWRLCLQELSKATLLWWMPRRATASSGMKNQRFGTNDQASFART